jgi:biopolymer transport protein ExbD
MPRHPDEHVPEIVLPITPMLDMTFQLLFFFIVTFNPSKEVSRPPQLLAEEQSKQAVDPKNINPLTKPDDRRILPKSTFTLAVERRDAGDDKTLLVSLSTGGNETFNLETEKGTQDCIDRLTQLFEKSGDSPSLTLETKGETKWKDMVQARDACLEAGFRDIRFAKPLGGG